MTALRDVNSCVSVSSVSTVMDITPRGVVLPQIFTLSVEGHDVKVNKLGAQGSCIVDIAVHKMHNVPKTLFILLGEETGSILQ